jgi:hypothetical protein
VCAFATLVDPPRSASCARALCPLSCLTERGLRSTSQAGPSAMEEDTGAATEEERQLRQLEAQRVAYQCLLRAMPVPASTLAHAGCSTAPDPARSPATAVDGPSCSGSGAPPLSAEQFIALRRSRPQQRVQQRLQQLASTRAAACPSLPPRAECLAPRRCVPQTRRVLTGRLTCAMAVAASSETPADLPPELQWQAVIEHKLMQVRLPCARDNASSTCVTCRALGVCVECTTCLSRDGRLSGVGHLLAADADDRAAAAGAPTSTPAGAAGGVDQ